MSNPADLVYTIAKDKLPDEWSLATISDLVGKDGVFVDGDWVESKDQDPDGDVRLIQLADIGDGEYRNRSDRFLTHEKAIQLGCTFLEKGDVLIARMPDPLGRACIFPGDQKRSVTVVDVAIVRPAGNAFDARWLMYFVNTPAFRSAVSSMQSGSTRKRISRGNLSKIVLPVPPLDQQKRVVAEIEKQFSRLDEAVANLKRVKANLKRYKAAVLKAAVEGRLVETEAELARREGRSYETGAKLLQRILATRRSQWQGKGKYNEPAAPDTTDLLELPEGWMWASVGQLGAVKGGKRLPAGHTYAEGRTPYPYIRVTDFENYGVRTSELQYLKEETQNEIARYTITSDDIYISIAGSIGLVGQVPEQLSGANLTENAAKITELVHVAPMYLVYWLSSPTGIVRISDSTIATTQAKLALFRIEQIPVPFPPLAEQRRIVAEVDRRLSLLRETEAQVDANLQRAERTRQAVLSAAFYGSTSINN